MMSVSHVVLHCFYISLCRPYKFGQAKRFCFQNVIGLVIVEIPLQLIQEIENCRQMQDCEVVCIL